MELWRPNEGVQMETVGDKAEVEPWANEAMVQEHRQRLSIIIMLVAKLYTCV